jgi:hypothetical protein
MTGPTDGSRDDALLIEVEPGVWLDLRPGAVQDDAGCDLSLIDRCLDRTPWERVFALRGFADLLAAAEGADGDRA